MGARVIDGRSLAEFTTKADVLIVAAGVPELTKKEHVSEGGSL